MFSTFSEVLQLEIVTTMAKKQMLATFGSLMIVMAMAEVNIQAKAMWHPTLPIIIIVMIMVGFQLTCRGRRRQLKKAWLFEVAQT